MIKYIIENYGNKSVLLAPVIVPKYNEDQIEPLVKLCCDLKIRCGLQKFLNYVRGKNPVKADSWEKFYCMLKRYEKRYNVRLILDQKKDFGIHRTRRLIKPIKRSNVVKARIIAKGRYFNNWIGYVFAENDLFKGRLVEIINNKMKKIRVGERVNIRITRDKHNIYFGEIL